MTQDEIFAGLDRWFGHDDFRTGQYAPIEAVVNGRDAVYYVIEEPIEGIKTKYSNTGMQSDVTDRAYNGGTITNSGVPATGDTNKPVLWSLLTLLAMAGCVLLIRKGKKTVKR